MWAHVHVFSKLVHERTRTGQNSEPGFKLAHEPGFKLVREPGFELVHEPGFMNFRNAEPGFLSAEAAWAAGEA